MKYILPFMLALFPFLHNVSYEVELKSCENERIIVSKDGTDFEVTLFNLKMKSDEGWTKTCSILNKSEKITMEIDESSAVSEPLAVTLFADGQMLQEDLIRENLAYTLIHNPEYKYETRLLELEKSNQVMAQEHVESEYPYEAQGWKFLLFIFLIWLLMITYLLYKNKKLPFLKH